jgi:hypothetical protein
MPDLEQVACIRRRVARTSDMRPLGVQVCRQQSQIASKTVL